MRLAVYLAALIFAGSALVAAPIKLEPASPQPKVKPGLAVSYAYPGDVKTLRDAKRELKKAKPGKPLAGLDYRDGSDGEVALTSDRAHRVVADISGFVKFDAPGIYAVDFVTNDGLQVWISGKEVAKKDGRFSCQETREVEVEVPSAGWYPIKALYFQRLGSSCLHMRAGLGHPDWMPNSAFGH